MFGPQAVRLGRACVVGLAASAATASGARAETVFVGDTMVLSTTSACVNVISVGETARFAYRPAGAAFGNGADSYLSYIGGRSSFAMTVPGNTFRASVNYAGQAMGSKLNLTTGKGGITGWTQNPATLSTSTATAELVANFANFWGVKGCTVSIRSNLIKMD